MREEPQFVTARAGENVILGCDVSRPLNGQPYVVEWFKYGMPIPFFINFRFYPPHVDPEYAGKALTKKNIDLGILEVYCERYIKKTQLKIPVCIRICIFRSLAVGVG